MAPGAARRFRCDNHPEGLRVAIRGKTIQIERIDPRHQRRQQISRITQPQLQRDTLQTPGCAHRLVKVQGVPPRRRVRPGGQQSLRHRKAGGWQLHRQGHAHAPESQVA